MVPGYAGGDPPDPDGPYVLLLHHYTWNNDHWGPAGGKAKGEKVPPKEGAPVSKPLSSQEGTPTTAVGSRREETFPEAGARELAEETNYTLSVPIQAIRRPEEGREFHSFISWRGRNPKGKESSHLYVVFVVSLERGFDRPAEGAAAKPSSSSLYQMVSVMRLASFGKGKREHNGAALVRYGDMMEAANVCPDPGNCRGLRIVEGYKFQFAQEDTNQAIASSVRADDARDSTLLEWDENGIRVLPAGYEIQLHDSFVHSLREHRGRYDEEAERVQEGKNPVFATMHLGLDNRSGVESAFWEQYHLHEDD